MVLRPGTFWIKLVFWLGACALLVWLVLEAAGYQSRSAKLNAALEAQLIGSGLSGEENQQLYESLRILAEAAGVTGGVSLNAPFRPGALNVYTTTPAAQAITHCGKGNAVYDPELDAIFLDLSVLRPLSAERLASFAIDSDEGIPSAQLVSTYLHFLLAHELGHRQLHRNVARRTFDNGKPVQQLEDEADDFAVKLLFDVYRKHTLLSQVVASGFYKEASGMWWVNSEEMSEFEFWSPNRVSLDLVLTLQAMVRGMLWGDYPYSPFYADDAHKTFVARALQILNSLDRVPQLDAAIVNRREYMKRYFGRFAASLGRSARTVHLPVWMRHAAFDGDDIVVQGNTGETLRLSGGQDTAVRRRTGPDPFPWLALAGSRRSSTFGGSVAPPLGPPVPGGLRADDYLFEAREQFHPGRQTVVEVFAKAVGEEEGSSKPVFVSLGPGRPPVRLDGSAIEEAVAAASAGVLRQTSIDRVGWAGDQFFFQVSPENRRSAAFVDLLQCQGATLQCTQVHRLRSDGVASDWRHMVVVADNATIAAYVAVTAVKAGERSWQIWRLDQKAPPELIAARPYLSDEPPRLAQDAASGGLVDHYFERETRGEIQRLVVGPHQTLILNLVNDSCYLVHRSTRSVQVLFHPCGKDVNFAVSSKGSVAMFAANSQAFFLVDVKNR